MTKVLELNFNPQTTKDNSLSYNYFYKLQNYGNKVKQCRSLTALWFYTLLYLEEFRELNYSMDIKAFTPYNLNLFPQQAL